MAKKKKKYYVVWKGVEPGVYHSWNECQLQIKGYPGAKYKAFVSIDQAKLAFLEGFNDHIGQNKKVDLRSEIDTSGVIWDSLSVDAACSGSPGIMEYRGVWTKDKVEVFKQGPFRWGTNNVGEFLALVHGIAFLNQHNMKDIPIYSDSRTAISWLKNKKVKTTLERRESNVNLFKLLDRAEEWIKNNDWQNKILKWETNRWGEIPADFGRK